MIQVSQKYKKRDHACLPLSNCHANNFNYIKPLGFTALMSAMLFAISGCQSTPASSNLQRQAAIDFSRADSATVSAQSYAFKDALPKTTAEYQALFAQSGATISEQQAKLRLLASLNQHLNSPHWSSSQVRYHGTPFVTEGSIDQGADSIFKSLLDVYGYRIGQTIEALGTEDDNAEQVVDRMAQEADADIETDEVALDYPADNDDYDRNIFGITNLNPFGILQDYAEMRNQETAENGDDSMGVFPDFFSLLKQTPEQIAAKNEYQNQYFTINTLSRFDPKQKQIQSVLSYDYLAPTMSSSIQLPIAIDFSNNRLRVDPAAVMPALALISPEDALLPSELVGKTVDFQLTEKLRGNVPTGVIYDAVINAFLASMGEIDAASFTPIDIVDDEFAKDIRAARAIKINFDSKQSGVMVGRMFKHLTKSLNNYVKANPDNTEENAALQEILAKIAFYNQGYQTRDVGSLFQLIEAIAPIDFNNSNYYYLDANNRLIGKQQRANLGSGLVEARNHIVSLSRYDQDLSAHPLAPILSQTFDNAATGIDGNAWLKTMRQNQLRKQEALAARESYGLDEALEDEYSSNIVIDDLPNIDE